MDKPLVKTTATPNLTVGAVREQPLNSSPDQSAGINNSIPSVWEKYKVSCPEIPWEVTNLSEIMETDYPPLGFAIDNFLPHGLIVIAGEPKIGKSMYIQQMAYAVSTGTKLMGRYMATRGDVIYLALEDNCRRLQDRFSRYDATPLDAYDNIHVIFRAEGVDQNFVGQIYYLLEKYPNTQLILVDTLQYVRGKVSDKYSYETEYKMMLEFRKITQSFPVSLVLVTHTREADAKNAQRQIYGGGGIIGASDGNWTLVETDQTETEKRACLSMTNRDINSDDLELIFDKETLLWRCAEQQTITPVLSKDDMIVAVLIAMFADKQYWKGSATELLEQMKCYCTNAQDLQLAPNALARWLNVPEHQAILFRRARIRYRSGYKTIMLTNEAYFESHNGASDNIDGFLPATQK